MNYEDERTIVSDLITNAIEEGVFKELINRDQAKGWYFRLAHAMNLPDLVPLLYHKHIQLANNGKPDWSTNMATSDTKSVIIERNKGAKIPEDMLKLASSACNSCFGYALGTGTKVHMERAPMVDMEFLNMVNDDDEFQKQNSVFYLGKYPATKGELKGDMIQPFVLLSDKDDNPMLVCFLAGDFSQFREDKSEYPDEFFAVKKRLGEKVRQFGDMLGGDIKRVIGELSRPVAREEIGGLIGEQGGKILLLSNTGDLVSYTKDKTGTNREFPWGRVTDSFGFGKTPDNVKKSETPPPAGIVQKTLSKLEQFRLNKKLGLPGATQTPSPAVTEPATATPAEGDVAAPINNTTPSLPKQELVMIAAPIKWSKNQKRDFYNKHFGMCPEGYNSGARMASDILLKTSSLRLVQDWKTVSPDTAIISFHQADKKSAPVTTTTTTLLIPLLNKEQDAALRDKFIATLDAHSKKMPDPHQMQDMESKVPTFCERAGINLEDTFSWSFSTLMKLGNDASMEALALYALQLKQEYTALLESSKSDNRKQM